MALPGFSTYRILGILITLVSRSSSFCSLLFSFPPIVKGMKITPSTFLSSRSFFAHFDSLGFTTAVPPWLGPPLPRRSSPPPASPSSSFSLALNQLALAPMLALCLSLAPSLWYLYIFLPSCFSLSSILATPLKADRSTCFPRHIHCSGGSAYRRSSIISLPACSWSCRGMCSHDG